VNLPNIPFELIFIVLFFVLPAVSRLLGRRNTPSQGPQRRPQTQAERPGRSSTSPAPSSAESREAGDALSRRLEEARRRVQEAMTQETTTRETSGRGRPRGGSDRGAQEPAESDLFSRPKPKAQGEPRRTPGRSLEGRSLEGRGLEGRGLEQLTPELARAGTRLREDTDLKDAPPLRVQRLGRRERATISQREAPLALDETSVMHGIIWHQVLSPPLSKSRRTRVSRR